MQNITNNNLSPRKIRNSFPQIENINYNRPNIQEKIKGAIYIKSRGLPIKQLSDQCLISITFTNNSLNIEIKKKNQLLYTFPIENITNISQIINSLGKKYIIWDYNGQFYIFEFSNSSSNNEIQKIINSLSNKITDFGNIDNLDQFLDNNYNNINFNKRVSMGGKINNINQYLDKLSFVNSFNQYKEIYKCKGIPFKYDKYTNQLIPLYKEIDENSFIKIIDIGEIFYLLVIEKNEKILISIEIKEEHSIIINENFAMMSFFDNSQSVIIPYNIIFENNSIDEINYFKNVINRCLYETYNKLYQYKKNDKNNKNDFCSNISNSSISSTDSKKSYLDNP